MISCKVKQVVITEALRPQFEKRVPNSSDYDTVDDFFKTWSKKSIPISQSEFDLLDSLVQFGYEIYEDLITDTSFIGINPQRLKAKYVLIPNTFYIGYAKKYRKEYDIVFYDSIESISINDFRPRVLFKEKQVLYYTEEYQDTLPKFAEKYGVGSFLVLNSNLMSTRLRYFETQPFINGVIQIKNTDEYCINYRCGSRIYETLVKKVNKKWIKIDDLTILESD